MVELMNGESNIYSTADGVATEIINKMTANAKALAKAAKEAGTPLAPTASPGTAPKRSARRRMSVIASGGVRKADGDSGLGSGATEEQKAKKYEAKQRVPDADAAAGEKSKRKVELQVGAQALTATRLGGGSAQGEVESLYFKDMLGWQALDEDNLLSIELRGEAGGPDDEEEEEGRTVEFETSECEELSDAITAQAMLLAKAMQKEARKKKAKQGADGSDEDSDEEDDAIDGAAAAPVAAPKRAGAIRRRFSVSSGTTSQSVIGAGAPPLENSWEAKDSRGKKVSLTVGTMGLQVQGPKDKVPKTHLFQSLQGWEAMSGGHSVIFEMNDADATELVRKTRHVLRHLYIYIYIYKWRKQWRHSHLA
eukprot:COSAG06_NODE_699_length_12972_cov_41.323390_7_plen_366_part_00